MARKSDTANRKLIIGVKTLDENVYMERLVAVTVMGKGTRTEEGQMS